MSNESKFSFEQAIKSKRLSMTPAGRARSSLSRPKEWLYPIAWEKRYFREGKKLIQPLIDETRETMRGDLDRWLAEVNFDSYHTDEERLDQYPNEFNIFIDQLNKMVIDIFGEDTAKMLETVFYGMLGGIAAGVIDFNLNQFTKASESVTGYKYETADSGVDRAVDAWKTENHRMWKNVSQDFVSQVNEAVSRGVRNNTSGIDIRKEVEDIIRKNYTGTIDKEGKRRLSRAAKIARDQIGKLNGQLTKSRQQEVGLEFYIWRTSQDERVRGNPAGKYPKAIPSHFDMDGKLCRWDDDSLYADMDTDIERDEEGNIIGINWKSRTGKMPQAIPGEEILCRCTAITFMEPVIQQTDQEIKEQQRAA